MIQVRSVPDRLHRELVRRDRVLSLRNNFSAYDASYLALAELLDAEIVTADVPLAQAIRTHSKLRVLSA
jgi:predicted nucleic acid-binding protein